ncbi:hypothetical protein BGW38_001763 [Lunasporangiospora selenospora]|uniref:Ankyrin repeat-containing protein n=1 Tax=Lunasporangiospora selenospora TaxID=979761 RepID=A0A9P6KDV0_9FUNG|nr:hypothetical protein BGW38_001763 [Lunasporangiospora selenospora]
MSVDSSTRPNEIMDQDTMKNVHPQLMEAVAEEAAALDETLGETVALPDAESNTVGSEFKVEIPNSGMTYHPPAVADMVYSTTAMASTTALHTQLQSPVILQGGFPTHGAFVVPTSDIYQAATAVLSATALTATNGEPAIIATGALDSLALSKDIWQAAEQGDLETLRLHLDHGASPNNRNASRSTLLHRTAWQSTRPYDVMELLIRKGANVNLANDNGNTVMQNVLMKHDDPSLLKLLLDAGADTSITNKEGMNSLEVGVLFNRIEGVKFLLENDAESCSRESVLAALKRAKGEEKKTVRSMLNKCLGKEGEKRRSELILKAQADAVLASTVVSTSHYRGHSMQPSTSSTQGLQSQVHLLQNTSTVSLEGYRGKQSHEMDASESSKEGSVVHEDSASASSGLRNEDLTPQLLAQSKLIGTQPRTTAAP